MYVTPYFINKIYNESLLRSKEVYEDKIIVPGLTEKEHVFNRKRLEEKYNSILSGVKGLPKKMRYSQNKTGLPWIFARSKGSRFCGMTLESTERLVAMGIALELIRVVKHEESPCDIPYVVIDDEHLRKTELMKPYIYRRWSLVQW